MQINNKAGALLCLLGALLVAGCSSGGETPGSGSSGSALSALKTTGSLQGQATGFVDVDGDGIDDMIVSAPYTESPTGQGAAIVYKGSAGGFSTNPVMVLSGDTNFGYDFVNLGDIDGDGKVDFSISALNGIGDAVSLGGSVGVFKGGTSGQLIVKLAGDMALDKFG